jgi:hypothetical protein
MRALTVAQWKNSGLCYVISDHRLSDEEFEALYRQIDANGDQHLAWIDLVNYLTSHLRVDHEERQELIFTSQYPSKPKRITAVFHL